MTEPTPDQHNAQASAEQTSTTAPGFRRQTIDGGWESVATFKHDPARYLACSDRTCVCTAEEDQ